MSARYASERSPGAKLLLPFLIGALLAIPLFAIYLLVYDRQNQSATAQASISQGWGGAQVIAGPVLVIPYSKQTSETVTEGIKQVTKTSTSWHELTLSPDATRLRTDLNPSVRTRSIYDVVVYEAHNRGAARFSLPANLQRFGIAPESLALDRAQVRFGIKDARGLFGPPPAVSIGGKGVSLQPGNGTRETGGSGFFAWFDASELRGRPIGVTFDYAVRGNGSLALVPGGGDTQWRVVSTWESPSYQGGFLPVYKAKVAKGFDATWRVGNLALGSALVSSDESAPDPAPAQFDNDGRQRSAAPSDAREARVDLITPVDLYSQVNRSVKYGFLFIGFTFLAFLMFDVIGGVKVSAIEYGLVGSGLVLFFVMLLAFAEVIGFTAAYAVAGGAIIGLLTAYSAAVLGSWRRSFFIAGLLIALYGVLYVLLSLEDMSLLIGSVMIFFALAAVMYLTRGIDWGGTVPQSEAEGVPA
ncbi:MAG: colicin resistance protein [Sphingomonas bacterium]|uniref:cell envelope integrity protein CreD n=1 Tax=Sphingomonas bacterium TaxID=1895847 RepID=UPI002621739D|nr:cell envelope integrity protein CreD [Sphingomonas bacterium]MDB5703711.1 colicin resistance protein [Sphingomonas bacterium]